MVQISHTILRFTDHETVQEVSQYYSNFSRTNGEESLRARYGVVYASSKAATITPKNIPKSYLRLRNTVVSFLVTVILFC